MKNRVIKRFLAGALTAVLVLTSANLTVFASNETTPTNDKNISISDGQLIANNYDELSGAEKDVLYSDLLLGEIHTLTKPTDQDELTAVDSDNKVIYASNHKDGNYVWYPELAKIQVDGVTVETVTLQQGAVTYEGESYDASQNFTYGGDGYAVVITYNVYISDEEGALKERYLNLPYHLAEAMNNLAIVKKEVAPTLNTIIRYGISDFKMYVDGSSPIQIGGEYKRIILEWLNQKALYNQSKIAYLMNKEDTGYNNATHKIENILAYGQEYRDCIVETRNDLKTFGEWELLKIVNADMSEMIQDMTNKLDGPADSQWAILSMGEILDTTRDTAPFDALVEKVIGTEEHKNTETVTQLLAASTEVTCNVNRYNVTLEVAIKVVDADTNQVTTILTQQTVLNLAGGLSAEEVEAAIETSGFENAQIDRVNAYEEGYYGVNRNNYNRQIWTTLGESLTEDITFSVTYSPKLYVLDYVDEEVEDVYAPYGTVITFPLSTISGKSYEYTVNGQVYEEGTLYRLTGDVTVNRSLSKAKTPFRVMDLVAQNYDDILSQNAMNILYNLAIASENIYIRVPGEEEALVSIDEDANVVTAQDYYAGNGMTWEPYKAYVKNGQATVQTTEFDGNTVAITAPEYTTVEVSYRLAVDMTQQEILAALNLPGVLVQDAKNQLTDLNQLKGYEATLDQVKYGMLDLVKGKLNSDSQTAIEKIQAAGLASDGATLLLSVYLDEYKLNATDADRLNWYYSNNMYTKIKEQITLIADNVGVIAKDPNLMSVLVGLNPEYASYAERLETISEDLAKLKTKFQPKHEAIKLGAGGYDALLTLLVTGETYDTITSADGLYCTTAFVQTVDTKSTIKVVVQVADGLGNIGATSIKNYSDVFDKNESITPEDLAIFAEQIAEMEAALGFNKLYYNVTVEGVLPEAGTEITENITVTYTWTPKTYTLKVEGMSDLTFTADSRRVTLPGTGSNNLKYYYTIGNRVIEVGGEDVSITFTLNEIDTCFAEGSYTADCKVVDVSYENMLNLVTGLNEELKAAGLEYVASFVLVEDAEGNLSIVLRMNIQNENFETALQTIVIGLTSQSYVAIGDQPFVDGGVYMNAFIQAFLNSGLSTQSLEAMIDENGDIQENFSLEGTIVADTVVGIPNAEAFGGLLAETSLSISKGEAGVPMYITLQDHDQNPEEYKNLDASLQDINKTAVLEFANGAVNVMMSIPEDSFELYMGAMLLEGYLNLEDFQTPSFVEMKEYLDGLFLDTLVRDHSITGDTVVNTTDKLGTGADATSSAATIDGLLASLRELFDEDTSNGEAVEKNEEQQDKDLYKIEITYPTLKIATDMGLSEGMAELLRGDMVIPVNARLANCNEEYKSVVLDFGATEVKDMVVFDTTNHATTTNHNGMVVALADLESVIANGTTYVNLNGHTVTTLVANAKVTVFDTAFNKEKAGSILNFGGGGDVTLRGGDYDRWDVSDKLPSGFVQEDGYVSNVYYELEKDENGNLAINLKAETLGLQSQLHMQEIALSIFADLALCGFTWAGVTMEGEETYPLYAFDVHDLLGQWSNGTTGMGQDIMEDMNEEAISAFLNSLLAKLTDFDAVAEAIDQNKPIVVYDLYTYAWDVEIVKAETENMLTANIKKGTESKKTLTIAVIGDESEKEETKNLYEELDHIFGGNKGMLDILVDFHNISIQPEHGFGMDMNITANVAADLSSREYMAILGILYANTQDDPSATVALVNALLKGKEDAHMSLMAVLETLSFAQIKEMLAQTEEVTLDTMIQELGITMGQDAQDMLVARYPYAHEILTVLFGELSDLAGDTTLADSNRGQVGEYVVSSDNWHGKAITFTIILGEEVVKTPTITLTTKKIDAIKSIKVDGNYIYFDVVNVNGITEAEFLKALNITTDFGKIDKITFSDSAAELVKNGETITITAVNTGIVDTNKKATASRTYTIILLGDVSGDGRIRANDATLILRHNVGLQKITDENALQAAMINKSAGLDAGDATIILRHNVGLTYKTWLE